jgi:hypothetical protein
MGHLPTWPDGKLRVMGLIDRGFSPEIVEA